MEMSVTLLMLCRYRTTRPSMKRISHNGSTTLEPLFSNNPFFSTYARLVARPTTILRTTSPPSNRSSRTLMSIPPYRHAPTTTSPASGSPGIRSTRCIHPHRSSHHEQAHHPSWVNTTSKFTDVTSSIRGISSLAIIRGVRSGQAERSGT
jgi:hypothetical protein